MGPITARQRARCRCPFREEARRLCLSFSLAVAALVVSGCGGGATITVVPPSPATDTPATMTTGAAAPAPAPVPRTPSYPVAFILTIKNPHAVWPFTAQLASLTLNPNGFPGSGAEPPQDSYLMVQVNITSGITGRLVPPPNLQSMIVCHGPRDHSWSSLAEGYDADGSAPDITGFNVAMGDGRPHPWDIEWVVPNSTPVARVKCELGPDPYASSESAPFVVKVVGKRRLD